MTDYEMAQMRKCIRLLDSLPYDDARITVVRDVLDALVYAEEALRRKDTAGADTPAEVA